MNEVQQVGVALPRADFSELVRRQLFYAGRWLNLYSELADTLAVGLYSLVALGLANFMSNNNNRPRVARQSRHPGRNVAVADVELDVDVVSAGAASRRHEQ